MRGFCFPSHLPEYFCPERARYGEGGFSPLQKLSIREYAGEIALIVKSLSLVALFFHNALIPSSEKILRSSFPPPIRSASPILKNGNFHSNRPPSPRILSGRFLISSGEKYPSKAVAAGMGVSPDQMISMTDSMNPRLLLRAGGATSESGRADPPLGVGH